MENKRFFEVNYTEEQWSFIRKYGEDQLYSWERMNDSQKKEYQEIENYYSVFANLLNEHYEDLKLYALMYRNVALYNCDKDPISILFFASKQNEIIGFKKKLETDKDSDKAKIAFLYYDNAALFPKVIKKYIGKNLKPILSTNQIIYRSLLNDFNTKNYNHIFSICDLNEIECKNILSNEKHFKDDYVLLCDNCEEEFYSPNNFVNTKDFIEKYFIPKILKDNLSFQHKRILRYLRMKYPKNWIEEITILKRNYNEYIEQLNYYEAEKKKQISRICQDKKGKSEFEYFSVYSYDINRLKHYKMQLEFQLSWENSQALHKTRYIDIDGIDIEKFTKEHKELQDKYLNLKNKIQEVDYEIEKYEKLEREQKRENRIERQRQEQLKEEKILKKENEQIDYLKSEAFDLLINQIEISNLFNFIYLNYKNIEQYVTTSYEKLYNILWLRKPEYMKALEFRTTCANFIRNIFDSDHRKKRDAIYFSYIKYIKTNKEKFIFKERNLMKQWCEIINKEYEEAEKREREQERIKEEKRRKEDEQKRKNEEARMEKFRFNQKNYHSRDSYISFDEVTHSYKVNCVTLQSVTNFVEGCFPKFNAEFFAEKKAIYLGKTTQEVLDMWEQKGKVSRELGTELHKKIENYFKGITSSEDDTFKLFLMFANKVELKPYRSEWVVYDVKHNIAGTIDFVDYQNGEYIIYDWKRSDKIINNGMPIKISKYEEKGNYPLEHLDNTPYYHYALQLSIYKFILENNYNIKISDLRLGIFHPTYNKPYVLRIPYLEKEINDLFNLRSEVLF